MWEAEYSLSQAEMSIYFEELTHMWVPWFAISCICNFIILNLFLFLLIFLKGCRDRRVNCYLWASLWKGKAKQFWNKFIISVHRSICTSMEVTKVEVYDFCGSHQSRDGIVRLTPCESLWNALRMRVLHSVPLTSVSFELIIKSLSTCKVWNGFLLKLDSEFC